jgi:hypothetical protein
LAPQYDVDTVIDLLSKLIGALDEQRAQGCVVVERIWP